MVPVETLAQWALYLSLYSFLFWGEAGGGVYELKCGELVLTRETPSIYLNRLKSGKLILRCNLHNVYII